MKFAFATIFALSMATVTAHAHDSSVRTDLLAACDKTLLFKDSIISPVLVTEKYYVEDSDGEVYDVEKVNSEDLTTFRFVINGVEHAITRSFEWDGKNGQFIYRRNGVQCQLWIVQPD